MSKIRIGQTYKISEGSGIDSGEVVRVVKRNCIILGHSGVPTNVLGAYKPPNWNKESAILYQDGSYGIMFNNRLLETTENFYP